MFLTMEGNMESILLKKIEDLFEYRAFPELYRYSNAEAGVIHHLHQDLMALQKRIYHLDAYLETNWTLDPNELKRLWDEIYTGLIRFKIEEKEFAPYCRQIFKYQKHEVDLRYHKLPTRLDMEYFYFYKSCDVKLLRRILQEQLPSLKPLFSLADWRYFDLITEINDDVCDLEEDMHTINGNRVLISLNEIGKEATLEIFGQFIADIEGKSQQRFAGMDDNYRKEIHSRTLMQARLTIELLRKKLDHFGGSSTFVLYQHLGKENRA
ncbi:MAG: hypothetical protein IPN29_12575 [Saprospiraceae bacterium]|nr:hypothetical protein [Saprospiraceae bacterium]